MRPFPIRLASLVAGALLLGSCSETEGPVPANCDTLPAAIDFGEVLRPPESSFRIRIERRIEITNRLDRVSRGGNMNLDGTLRVVLVTPNPTPPSILLASGSDTFDYAIQPGESAEVTLWAVVTDSTSTGLYVGTVEPDPPCDPVRFSVFVSAREEPPPVFVAAWGSEGSERGQFDLPQAVTVDSDGNVYVVDHRNERVQKFDPDGGFLREWRTWNDPRSGGDTRFSQPLGIAAGPGDQFVVVDSQPDVKRDRVTRFDAAGRYVSVLGLVQKASVLVDPWHLDVGPDWTVYVVEPDSWRIRAFRFVDEGRGFEEIRSWGSHGEGPGRFLSPWGIAVSDQGDVYVTDWFGHTVQKFTSTGSFVTAWGSRGEGAGQFENPSGIEVDGAGNVYVVDQGNRRIQKFDGDGRFITAWGAVGTGPGFFVNPVDVAVAADGAIYVVDQGNFRIQKFLNPEVP